MSVPEWMNPARLDLFQFWRFLLVVVCTIYAGIVTIRSAWGWAVLLAEPRKATMLLRQYLILHMLRVRFGPFARELTLIGLLIVAMVLLVRFH